MKSEFPRFEAAISGEGYGFVYVMSYPDSSKVKIGHALHPDTRASNIGGTLAPEDPQLEAYYWCSENREKVERAAHSALAQHRGKGEWFSVSVPQAMQAIAEKYAQDMIDEVRTKLGISHGVGAYEPNVPGEELERVAIELEDEE